MESLAVSFSAPFDAGRRAEIAGGLAALFVSSQIPLCFERLELLHVTNRSSHTVSPWFMPWADTVFQIRCRRERPVDGNDLELLNRMRSSDCGGLDAADEVPS
eukprot:3941493-Rhodomonas_salina.4